MINKKTIDRPIFLFGVPRSGTTITSEILSAHETVSWFSNHFMRHPSRPMISALNRITDIPYIGCHLYGKKLQKNGIIPYIRRKILPYSVEAYPVWQMACGRKFLYDYLLQKSATKEEAIRLKETIQAVLFFHGKDRFFTKYTGPSKIAYLDSIFPDAFFIHIIRDPRAVTASLMKVRFWNLRKGKTTPWWHNGLSDGDVSDWITADNQAVALAAVQWRNIIQHAHREAAHINKNRYLEVFYEDLITSPMRTINNICTFVGLPFSKRIERYVNTLGKVQNFGLKFHKNLNRSEIHTIESITRRIAHELGYNY